VGQSVSAYQHSCLLIAGNYLLSFLQEERLRGRGSETEESLTRRLDLATREIDYSKTEGSYDHRIVNDDVDIAYEKFRGILCADAQEVVKNLHKADH